MSEPTYLYGLGKRRHIEKVFWSGRAWCGAEGHIEDVMVTELGQSPESLRAVQVCAHCERLRAREVSS